MGKLNKKQKEVVKIVNEMLEVFDTKKYEGLVRAYKQYRDLMEALDGMTVGEFKELFPSDDDIGFKDEVVINVLGDTLEAVLGHKGNPTWDKVCICIENLILDITYRGNIGTIMTSDVITRTILEALDITQLDIEGKVYSVNDMIKYGSGKDAYYYVFYAVEDFMYDADMSKFIKNNSCVFDLEDFTKRLISELYVYHKDILAKKYAIRLATYVRELHEMILLGYYYCVGVK